MKKKRQHTCIPNDQNLETILAARPFAYGNIGTAQIVTHIQGADIIITGVLQVRAAKHEAFIAYGGDGGVGHGSGELVLHYIHSSAGVVLEIDQHDVV